MSRWRRGRSERGAAAVVGVVLCAAVVVITVAAAALGRLLVDHRRAAAAADLAALAGAAAVQRGADGCAAAGSNAARNGVRLEGCVSRDEEVRVSVRLGSQIVPLGRSVQLQATARAGPVSRR